MRRALHAILVLAVLAGGGYGVLVAKRFVDARSLDEVIVEEPPQQPATPSEPRREDPRLLGLGARGDEARLLVAPGEGESIVRASFADNGTLVVASADTAAHVRVFTHDLSTRSSTGTLLAAEKGRSISPHRAAHKNAGVLCFSAPSEVGTGEAWCADEAGRRVRRVTTHDGPEDVFDPTVAPDGNWLAFEVSPPAKARPEAGSAIWKIGLNGANLAQLTRGADDRFPSWSADGRLVYFQRRSSEGRWDPYVMDADGKNPRPIIRTPDQDERWPSERLGAEEIVMASGPEGESRVVLMHLETKASTAVTSGAYGPETHPSVSPDGKLVAFLAPLDPTVPELLAVWIAPLDQP